MDRMGWLAGQHHESEDPAGWRPLLWTTVVIMGAVTAATMALPSLPQTVSGQVTVRALFHPEWLVVATMLVFPVHRAVRHSWRTALLVVPVACVQVLYVADTAVDTLQQAGFASAWYDAWYAVAILQAALFLAVGVAGAARDVRDRRWVRTMHKLTGLGSPTGVPHRQRTQLPLPPPEDGHAAA
jgi:hypothetical protein